MSALNRWYATGKRKEAVARVWLRPGKGSIVVNNRTIEDYFGRETLRMIIRQPFSLINEPESFDVSVNVRGGGLSGQAGAIKHGITKALLVAYQNDQNRYPEVRGVLKRAGFITRDARMKERKKYGQRGARARFQFSKR